MLAVFAYPKLEVGMDTVKIKTEPPDEEYSHNTIDTVKDDLIMCNDNGLLKAGRQSRNNVSQKIGPVRTKRTSDDEKHDRKLNNQQNGVRKPNNRAKRKSDQNDDRKATETSIETEKDQYVKSYIQYRKSRLYNLKMDSLNVAEDSEMDRVEVKPNKIEGVFESSRTPLEFDICSKELRNIRDNITDDNVHVKVEPVDITIDEIDVKKEISDQEDFYVKNDLNSAYEEEDNDNSLDKESQSEDDDCDVGDLSDYKLVCKKAKADGYVCTTCYKKYKTKRLLSHHRLVHTQDRPHPCRICTSAFKEQATLRRHMWTHLEKQHKCTVCDKHFVEKHSMDRHMRTIHAGDEQDARPKPERVLCETCNKDFKSDLLYQKHALCHGDPDFECPYCKRVYAGPSHLKAHVRIHTGERPYPCDMCSSRFTFKHVLKQHLNRVHNRGVKYECNLCLKSFDRKSDLSKHFTGHLTERPDEDYQIKKKLNRVKKLQQEILLLNNVLKND